LRHYLPKALNGTFVPVQFTSADDAIVRQVWTSTESNQAKGLKVSRLINKSPTACIRRAIELGIYASVRSVRNLVRGIGENNAWTEQELAILEAYSHLSMLMLQKRLQAIGSQRSLPAITRQLRKHQFREHIGLNHTELAAALGVCTLTLLRWRRDGKLKGQRLPSTVEYVKYKSGKRRNQRGRAHEDNAECTYTNFEIRRFVARWPGLIDLRRVDQTWFLDLVNSVSLAGCKGGNLGSDDKSPKPESIYEVGEEPGPSTVSAMRKRTTAAGSRY
jgi:hypothetical protein